MLFSRDGWERVAPRLAAADLEVDPVILERDGRLTRRERELTIGQAEIDTAWFDPALFPLGQDEDFLALVIAAPDLEWMQSGRSGFDNAAFAKLVGKGVRVTMSKAPAPAIAEFVIGSVLDRFQRGPERRAAQAGEHWRSFPFKEIAGSRWLLIGYGEIGREIAVRLRALGAHVTGVRRRGGSDADADTLVTPERMGEPLGAADVVVLSVPLTGSNDGAYDAAFFAGIGRQAVFVNVGRGQLLDEDALKAALDSGAIEHAILDVTRVEPLPPGAWQWGHPRITLSGHMAALGSGLIERTDALLVENLRRYRDGTPLLHELGPGDFA